MVQYHTNSSNLVALQRRIYRILDNIALPRSFFRLTDFSQMLVVVKQRVIRSKVSFIIVLEQLLYRVVVESQDGDHVLPIQF